jgi:hypothetical protein
MENGYDDMGNYHDPQLRLERTDLAQQHFDRLCPDIAGLDSSPYAIEREQRIKQMTNHILQQIIGETRYRNDPEWGVWHEARRIEDENGLPDGVTAHDIYQHYIQVYEGGDGQQ